MSPRPYGLERRIRPSLRLVAATAVCGAVLGGLTQPARAGEDRDPPAGAALQQELRDLVATPGGPPGVIAVLQDGDRTEVYRAGVADVESGRPPKASDHMRIASVAKAFSGAVALRLVDRGRLRLDSTIGEVLPGQPAAWHRVTLRQLLNHTSGLPDYSGSQDFIDVISADPRHRFDSRRLLEFVADQDLAFRPGSRYQYSNSDNIAVALMAEAVTGHRYERLLRELVYEPLGLERTNLPQGYRLPDPFLHGYQVAPPAEPVDVSEAVSASGAWAAGGIVSTPKDLTKFIRGYAGGKLVSNRTREQQFTFIPGALSQPPGPGRNEAGLAIYRYTTRCGVVYGHTGNTAGYTQLVAATADGSRSLTFSITAQTSLTIAPDLLAQVRSVQEDFVCALLRE
ncbi:serine hydrolase domain-containing protein [Streptomyces antarcticus]|uniref:serine hydrolase domain-containing protein n=1 Tax=Streptomyces antarcticus TaxID=2996458 RepID=UPI00226E1D77|nr:MULTISPECIES: serine hydrolase domain-containing protein [unclassified Streptomyces]MCY0943006.1 serine hydrolase [Streptomyces sp. H34-AA3]MCZ4086313.1 serine hydrolase [Streptomyces sp. H34-S5]